MMLLGIVPGPEGFELRTFRVQEMRPQLHKHSRQGPDEYGLGRLDRERAEGADVSAGVDTASRSKRRYWRAARISSLGFTSCERL